MNPDWILHTYMVVPEHKQSFDVFTISGWNDLYDDGWNGIF